MMLFRAFLLYRMGCLSDLGLAGAGRSGVDGSGVDDVDIFKNYLFKIDSGQIWIFGMDETSLTSILSYTRDGNTVTFTPSFNGKYKSAVLHKIYGTDKESISWDCGNGQVYHFSRR